MSDATYKLKDAVKVMRETDDMSNSIQVELVSHTDKLNRMREKPQVINEVKRH